MYLGVDVGGTKTLVAVLDDGGAILEKRKFPTPHNYHHFLLELRHAVAHLETHDFRAAGIGIPTSRFNRETGVAYRFGNLPWENVSIQSDVEKIVHCPLVVENDAKMAALSEAMLVKDKYRRVLYVTLSTGIGYGLAVNGVIDRNIGDAGGRTLLLEYKGRLMPWEDFASGRAIVERFGKRAEEITDEATWQAIVRDLKLGFLQLIAIMQPEVVIIGGSVGVYFDRFGKLLQAALAEHETPSLKIPVLKQAERPEEAVIYGCYDLAKATFTREQKHAKAA